MEFKATHVVVGNDGMTSTGVLRHCFKNGTEVMEVEDRYSDEYAGYYVAEKGVYQYITRTNVQQIPN